MMATSHGFFDFFEKNSEVLTGGAMSGIGSALNVTSIGESAQANMETLIDRAILGGKDAKAIQEAMNDRIEELSRGMDRSLGAARAQIGASGVQMTGSPMSAMLEMQRVFQKDLEAAYRQQEVAVNRAYLKAINETKRARSIGDVAESEMLATGVSDTLGFVSTFMG